MKARHVGLMLIYLTIPLLVIQPAIIHAESQKIRVVVEDASIRSEPDAASRIIESPPVGSVYEVQGKVGEWYEIEFTSKVGVLVTGYIHEMFVEAEREVSKAPRTAKRRRFSLSPSIGFGTGTGSMRSSDYQADNSNLSCDHSSKFGVAWEYYLNSIFGVGFHYSYAHWPSRTHEPEDDPGYSMTLRMYGAYGKLALVHQGPARPYALLGLGAVVVDGPGFPYFNNGQWYQFNSMDTRRYVLFGGGLDYSISSRLWLFGEVTADYLIWDGAALWSHEGAKIGELDQGYWFFDWTLGISVKFGGFR